MGVRYPVYIICHGIETLSYLFENRCLKTLEWLLSRVESRHVFELLRSQSDFIHYVRLNKIYLFTLRDCIFIYLFFDKSRAFIGIDWILWPI